MGAVSAVLAATSHYCLIAFDAESAVLAVTSLVDSWPVLAPVSWLHSIFVSLGCSSFIPWCWWFFFIGSFSYGLWILPKRDQRGVWQLVIVVYGYDRFLVIWCIHEWGNYFRCICGSVTSVTCVPSLVVLISGGDMIHCWWWSFLTNWWADYRTMITYRCCVMMGCVGPDTWSYAETRQTNNIGKALRWLLAVLSSRFVTWVYFLEGILSLSLAGMVVSRVADKLLVLWLLKTYLDR